MRRVLRVVALILVLPAVSAVCFRHLLARPDALIVDGRRPSIDRADRGHTRGLGNDLTSVFLPRFCYIAGQTRANGRRPAWDATGFGGRPLVGNPQAGLNYPPVWVAWWTGRVSSLGWLTVAHLLWAGVGVYVLTRSLDFGRPASVVAGGCFEASPYLIAHTFEGHYPHVWSASWYPWAFWGVHLATRRKAIGYWVLPAVLAMTFLTGHPQEWYFLVVALTLWVGSNGLGALRAGVPLEGIGQCVRWVGLLAVSLGLCAVDLGPEVAVKPWLLKTSQIPLEHVNRYQLHSMNFLQLLSPFALGRPQNYAGHDNYWETVLSVGLAPLVLAVIGVISYRDRSEVRRWGAMVVLSVVFAAGRKLGLYSLAYAVLPGMDRFRVPSRSLFLASLGASILAGAGAQTLRDGQFSVPGWAALKSRLRVGLVAAGLAAALLWCVSSPRSGGNGGAAQPSPGGGLSTHYPKSQVGKTGGKVGFEEIFWLSLAGMFGAFLLARAGRRGQVTAAWGFSGVALVELSLYAQSLLVCAPAETFLGSRVFDEASQQFRSETTGPPRVASLGNCYPDLAAAVQGLEKTNVNDGFQIQHSADLYERLYPILDPANRCDGIERPMDAAVAGYQGTIAQAVLNLMGVRYLVADNPLPLKSVAKVVQNGSKKGPPSLWTNRTALPRAYVVPRAVVDVRNDGETAARRLSERDPRDAVLLNPDPLGGGDRQPYTPAEWRSHDPDAVTIHVATGASGLLVVGNTWMPGWTASVDDAPAPVLRGNHCQQVVPITKAGRHEVVLRYEPPGYEAGKAITIVVGIAWAGAGLALVACRAWQRSAVPNVFRSEPCPRRGWPRPSRVVS